MNIEIETDDGKKHIECKNPKGRHVKKGLKRMTKIEGPGGEHNAEALDKYMDYLDGMTAELTGMTVEQLDDLDCDEKNKLVGHYQGKVENRIDFLRSSSKSENSAPKEKS